MKQFDVVALGEVLIDFTNNGVSEQGNALFEANPGGAPCNVLAMLKKLGHSTAFIGKVGQDMFGQQLKDTLQEVGIHVENLIMDSQGNTTLAFIHTLPDGDRDFSFYRNPGADMLLLPSELNSDLLNDTKIFHFGSLSMTHEGVREATKTAIEIAKKAGAIISFDPNLRPLLWNDLEEAKEQIHYGLKNCNILKISDNEIRWFTGIEDFEEGIRFLQKNYDISLILLSLGKDGSRAYLGNVRVQAPAFIQTNTIETTGAGDTFCGSCLHYVLNNGLDQLTENTLKEMLLFANAAASIITTKKGALRVMPSSEDVQNLIMRRNTTEHERTKI